MLHDHLKMPQYLVRFAQVHENFRKAELLALAEVAGVAIEIVEYSDEVSEDFENIALVVSVSYIFNCRSH